MNAPTAVEAAPPKTEIRATLAGENQIASERTYLWGPLINQGQFVITLGTHSAAYDIEDNSDVLPSRAVEQEVLDMIDEPVKG